LIIVIGDSHTIMWQNRFETYSYQMLMYQVANNEIVPKRTTSFIFKQGHDLIGYKIKHKLNRDDHFLFIFGEIDCRMYLAGKTNEELILLATNYTNRINEYRKEFNSPESKFIIQSITPPTRGDIPEEIKSRTFFNGTIEERVKVTKFMNDEIKKRTKYFLDVYDYYADGNGELNDNYIITWAHINSKYNKYAYKKLMQIVE
jgi:hypothetical protein